jgi:hypothetical protein
MTADQTSIVVEVGKSLTSGNFGDGDLGMVALAKHYANLIDDAVLVAASFDDLDTSEFATSAAMYKRLEKLEAAVNVYTVAATLGPKLMDALNVLGLSPEARSKLAKAMPSSTEPAVVNKPKSALGALRGEQDELAARRERA